VSGLRDLAKRYGLDPSQFVDDAAFAQSLLASHVQAQQNRHLFEQGQRYQQHAPQFEQWLQQQGGQVPPGAAPGQQQQQQSLIDRRPPFDARWMQLVDQDPLTGGIKAKPGAPADIVDRINAYSNWAAEWNYTLTHHPEQAIGPIIEQQVQKLLEARLGDFQTSQTARNLLNENAHWLFLNENGRFLTGNDGQKVLSKAGELFMDYTNEAARQGIRDVNDQYAYALKMIRLAHYANLQQQNRQPGSPAPGAPPVGGGPAGAQPPQSGGVLNDGTGQQIDQSLVGLSLGEKMRREFQRAGIKDADIVIGQQAA
jgi:hypothetical protein